ncbi:hypothetical protein PIB30_036600 [Stylosanthes scabra]|uniref:Uncharacterized protein n=1 Tax=Stylosanthes scabra TaxID=79078 RepID=A0ABU6QCY0_9FABA|nr:hypothetical protein [Stylosanthes scabra]
MESKPPPPSSGSPQLPPSVREERESVAGFSVELSSLHVNFYLLKEKYEVLSLFRRYRASVRRKNVAIVAGMHRRVSSSHCWYSRSRRIRLNRQLKTQPSLNPNSCPFPLLSRGLTLVTVVAGANGKLEFTIGALKRVAGTGTRIKI